jgi:hypothetical protein
MIAEAMFELPAEQAYNTYWGVVLDKLQAGPGSLCKADGVSRASACTPTTHLHQ